MSGHCAPVWYYSATHIHTVELPRLPCGGMSCHGWGVSCRRAATVAVRWRELPWLRLELPSSCHGCHAVG
eukprot:258265-Prymnesium_polylepis.1